MAVSLKSKLIVFAISFDIVSAIFPDIRFMTLFAAIIVAIIKHALRFLAALFAFLFHAARVTIINGLAQLIPLKRNFVAIQIIAMLAGVVHLAIVVVAIAG